MLLFYLVAPEEAVCFLLPSPSVHSGKSRLSATAWQIASYADILWARHAISLEDCVTGPKRLLDRPFVVEHLGLQPHGTWVAVY